MQKTVNSPTTSVVDMSLFVFLIFSYIFQHSDSASAAELFSSDGERCLLNSDVGTEYLFCIMACSTTNLSSVEVRQDYHSSPILI